MTLSRRSLLIGGLAFVLAACGGSKKGSPTEPSPAPSPGFPIGYSHVLHLNGNHAREVAEVGGRLLMAEPFYDSTAPLRGLRAAVDVMRGVGGHVIVVAVNANEPGPTAQNIVQQRVRRIKDEVGEASVWLEPVSEPWVENFPRSHAVEWARDAGWVGTIVETVHPCSVAQALYLIAPHRIVVTDCTPVLATTLGQADAVRLVRTARNRKAPFLLYDTFPDRPWNPQAVEWLALGLS